MVDSPGPTRQKSVKHLKDKDSPLPEPSLHETLIVVDFETTGLNPEQGDRVIEIGAVAINRDRVTDHFTSLIRPDFLISREIEQLTGISNLHLRDAPSVATVMEKFVRFIGSYPLLAHNAAFDQKFLESELKHFGRPRPLNFGCTLQLAKRIYPDLGSYKLESLVHFKKLPTNGQFHRALADAQMTARLWLAMVSDLRQLYGLEYIPFSLLKKACKTSSEQIPELFHQAAREARHNQIDTTGHLF